MATTTSTLHDISRKIDFSKRTDVSVLDGKSILVTGGASGLGLGIGTAMAEAGAYVTLADIDAKAGKAAEERLKTKGFHVFFIQTDVTSWESQTAAFKAAIAHSPEHTLDLVIPSAGLGGRSILESLSPHGLASGADLPAPRTEVLDVNLYGVYYTTCLALHYFKVTRTPKTEHETKHLLLIASMAGFLELPLAAEYQISKYGVRAIFKSLRDYGMILGNVRINLVAPWFVSTPIVAEWEKEMLRDGFRIATVPDFVEGVMRCCCDEDIKGRAIAILPGETPDSPAGSGNFDLCDDLIGGDGSRLLLEKFRTGAFGKTVDFAKHLGLKP